MIHAWLLTLYIAINIIAMYGGMDTNMRRTQIYLEEEQHRVLQEMAQEQRTTMAHVVREAIEAYMVRLVDTDDALLEIIALGSSGDPYGSVEHDRDIYADP